MNLSNIISNTLRRWTLGACVCAVLAAPALTSCDSFIYDDEGDCDPHYKVRFRYDYNLKYADAFPVEVNEVTLYIYDSNGNIVWSRHDDSPAVRQEGYIMDVDIAPGTYSLVAWAGKGHKTHFSVSEGTHNTDLQCRLQTKHDESGTMFHDERLDRLYHGKLDIQEFPDEQGEHVYTVNLMKDTNEFTVILQHLSGEQVDKDKFTFTITDDNTVMDWDNKLIPQGDITYYEWDKKQGNAGIIYPKNPDKTSASRADNQFSAAVARLTTGRLVKENDARMTVYNEKKDTIFSIPLIDYCLLVKGNYDRPMEDQEYLDRQDEYNMTFFLDDGGRWIDTYIYINSWKVLLQHTEM